MELFTDIIMKITPTWIIMIVVSFNAILLLYRDKLQIDSFRNYKLHAIGLLLTASFYALLTTHDLFDVHADLNYVAITRFTLMWQQAVWGASAVLNIWENRHGHK